MAKVTFINAIVSGKLEGSVYSRNKGGYYVKGYSKPLNPNTQAQNSARVRFGTAASAWHALTDIQKAQWNSYAETHYRPKDGMLVSFRSGFQAFVALYNGSLSAQQLARATTVSLPVGITITQTDFVPVLDAPTSEFSAMIQDSTGAPLPLLVSGATINSADAEVTVTFDMIHSQSAAPQFLDAVGSIPCGIIVQMSKAMTQSQQFVQNRKMTIVAACRPIDAFTGWTSGKDLTLVWTSADFDITKYKLWCQTGEKVNLEVYLVGENGAQSALGAITVTAA